MLVMKGSSSGELSGMSKGEAVPREDGKGVGDERSNSSDISGMGKGGGGGGESDSRTRGLMK